MKTDRLYAITVYLLNHGKTPAEVLARLFGGLCPHHTAGRRRALPVGHPRRRGTRARAAAIR